MDEHGIRKILEGGGGTGGALARSALWIPGKCYGGAMRLRRAAYRHGLLPSFPARVPVVSVGNLTAGGSGKTPFVILLASDLIARGRKPAILLRGYRQSADGLSDEAILYRERVPDALVVTGADRVASAEKAAAAGADIILLDDGFQHLRLRRDFDIVLVDCTSPWGGGNTLPGGLLREPKSALARADAVILTRTDQASPEQVETIRAESSRLAPGAQVLISRHRPARLRDLAGRELALSDLSGKRVVALAGIARPEAFRRTLESLGAEVAAEVTGKDHDHFTRESVDAAVRLAGKIGGVAITTEKDRAKKIFGELADNNVDNYNVWTMGVDLEVGGWESLLRRVEEISRQ